MIATEVRLRTATVEDAVALRPILAATVADHLGALPEPVLSPLVAMQLDVRERAWADANPHAENLVIDVDGAVAGRALVDRSSERWVIIDLVVEGARRGRGIATAAIRSLQNEAPAIDLHVWSADARTAALYARLGFVAAAAGSSPEYSALSWEAR